MVQWVPGRIEELRVQAEHFGAKLDYPRQYARCRADLWPGAALARPAGKAKAAA